MPEKYLTSEEATAIFNKLKPEKQVEILKKALLEKCDTEDHTNYMILSNLPGVRYSDVWNNEKDEFFYIKETKAPVKKKKKKIKPVSKSWFIE